MITSSEAKGLGFTIDSVAAGRPYAYKGNRFNPTDGQAILTDLEAEMLTELDFAVNALATFAPGTAEEERIRALVVRIKGMRG